MKLIKKKLGTFIGRDITFHLITSFVIHLVLIAYGELQDRVLDVKYTDIDYVIFTGGARHMLQGGSPFDQDTYRYTPWLAWAMQPNLLFFYNFGKILFSLLDVVCGWLLYRILPPKVDHKLCSLIWLYNPLTLIISTRGSSESIITTLVFLVIFFLNRRHYCLAGAFLGFVVHFKIYPIIYALPLYLVIDSGKGKQSLFHKLLPNKQRICFALSSVLGLVVPSFAAYKQCGQLYLEEAWLYHFHRQDLQHNFSPYFYIYQTIQNEWHRKLVSLAAFGPQFALIIACALYYNLKGSGNREANLYMSLFTQTFLFVTLNKVITAQYFEWYMCFIPMIVPFLDISMRNWILIFIFWSSSIIQWLLPAYLFEFRKWNVFHWLGSASFAFVFINIALLAYINRRFMKKQAKKSK